MKAKRVKSLIALLLVVALMLPTMPFSFAAGGSDFLKKTAVKNPDGTYTVTLTVADAGTQLEPEKNDIVLLIDASGSMEVNGKIVEAKAAAKQFVTDLLQGKGKTYNRISLITFGDGIGRNDDFSNDVTVIHQNINRIRVLGLTNIQVGLKAARERLEASTADNKHIVLLSDGLANLSYSLRKKPNGNFYIEDFMPNPDTGSPNKYISKPDLPISSMNYAIDDYYEDDPSDVGSVEVGGGTQVAKINAMNQALSEATHIRNSNTKIQVIAYDVSDLEYANIAKLASKNSVYRSYISELLQKFKTAGKFVANVQGAVVTDPIGEQFDLVGNPTITGGQSGVAKYALSPDRRTITWTIGDLVGKATMTYKIKLKPGFENAVFGENQISTNGRTTITYNNGAIEKEFVVPKLDIVRITYKDDVSGVQKVYNYIKNDQVGVKTDVQVGFTPPQGKVFDKWIDKNQNAVTGNITVTEDTVLTVVWKDKPLVKVTVTAHAGVNGTGTATNNQVIQDKTQWSEIEAGLKAAMKANVGYKFSHWSYTQDGTRVVQPTDKFTQPNTDVYAIFVIDNMQWANVGAKSNNETMGTVNKTVSSSIIYNDTPFSLIKNSFNAQPKLGYRLVKWTVEKTGATITDSYKFQPSDSVVPSTPTQRGGIIVIAHFEKDPSKWFDITGAPKDPSTGSVTVQGGKVNVATGTTWGAIVGKFKATPQPGYKFEKWVLQNGTVVTNTYQFTGNTTVYAVFVKDSAQYVTVRADKKDNHGTVTGEQSVLIGTVWSSIMNKFTAVPSNGFLFDKWVLHDGTALTPGYEFRVSTTVYATFKKDATKWIDVTAGTKGNGTATGAVNVLKGTAWSSISSNFSHKANPGYKFDKWVLQNGTEVKPGTTFNANTVVYATFVVDNTQYVDISGSTKPGANGTVTGGPARILTGKTWADIPSNTFKTTPSPGYRFDKWVLENGQVVTNTTVFTKNTVVYATFVKDAAQWIDVTAGTKGNGTATGAVNVLKGTAWSAISSNFSHKANPGYKFDKWVLENGTEVKAGTTFNANTVVYATFVVDNTQYINISGSTKPGANGTVTGGPARILTGKTWADIPSNTFKTTPSPGYRFDKWVLENGQVVTNTTVFTKNTVVYATFVKDAAQWIDVTAGTKGNGTATGAVNVLKGTAWSAISSNFSHKANPGYKFDKWVLENGTEVKAGTTFNANTVVYATFVKDTAQYTTVTVVVEGKGTISPSPTIEILKGTKWPEIVNKLTPNPAPGYEFQKWTDDKGQPIDPAKPFNDPTTVKAVFVLKQITVKVELNTAQGTIKGTNYTGVANVTLGNIKNIFNVEAKPGYVFAGWQLKGGSAINDGHVFHDNATVVALFNKVQEITITAQGVNGTVTPGTVTVPKGTKWPEIVNKLTPNPAPGYEFQKWTDDKGQPIDPAKPFNESATVKAVFVKKQITISVDKKPAEGGNVTGPAVVKEAGVTWADVMGGFTQTPNPGYKFTGWKLNDGTAVTNATVFNSDTVVYATYSQIKTIKITGSVAAPGGGKLTVYTKDYPVGTKFTDVVKDFNPVANPGYKVEKWTQPDGSTIPNDYVFTAAQEEYNIKVHFVKAQIKVTIVSNPADAADITGTPNPLTQDSGFTWGDLLKIYNYKEKNTAKYTFLGWYKQGATEALKPTDVFMEDATVEARFVEKEKITVKAIVIGTGGTVSPLFPLGVENIYKGTPWSAIEKLFTVTADPGKKPQWTLDNAGNNPIPNDKAFTEDTTVYVKFVEDADQFITVNAKVYLDEGGTVSPDKAKFLKTDTYAKLDTKFTPNKKTGYVFVEWVDAKGNALDPTQVVKDGDTVYAKFVKVNGEWIKITAKVIGEGEIKPSYTTEILKSPATPWRDIKDKDFKPDPKPGYKFLKWVLNPTDTEEISDTQTFNDGDVVYAIFERDDAAHMNVLAEAFPPEGGTATPHLKNILKGTAWSLIRNEYEGKPNPGYEFIGWYVKDGNKLPMLGDDTSVYPDFVFNAPEVVIQAKFREISDMWIVVTGLSNGNGKVISGSAKVLKGSTWTQITNRFAVQPDAGYRFSHWTDQNGNRLLDTYQFDFSQNVYANFEPIPAPPTTGGDRPNRPRDEYQEFNPPENTAISEDDVALGVLNYNDYYAYIQGYPDGSVRSSAYVNREETAAIFFRLLEPKYKETIRSENNNFKDISKSNWSNKHISTLANGGIIRGYSDGTFRPRAAITRAELAVIAAKFDRVQGNTAHNFTDVKGHWAEKYIANANYKGWIKGYPSGEFRPDVPITRAEFVTFINKVLGRSVKKTEIPAGVKTFTDLHPNAWYYENMVTATNSYLAKPGEDGYQKWSELVHIFIEM